MSTTAASPPCHQIGPYTLRPANEQDRALLSRWIEDDPAHAGKIGADLFIAPPNGEDGWALEDAEGRVVFYLHIHVAARLHIQFDPTPPHHSPFASRERNRDALTTGLQWLEAQLAANQFREMIFDSQSSLLIRTAEKRLGFARAPDDLVRYVAPIAPHSAVGTTNQAQEVEA